MADANPSDLDLQSELARVYNGRGIVLRVLARPDEALADLERGGAIVKHMVVARSADSEDLSRLATDLSNIGLLLNELGRTAEAVSALEESRVIYQRLADAQPNDSKLQNDLAACDNNLGLVLSGAGRAAEALTALKRGSEPLGGALFATIPRSPCTVATWRPITSISAMPFPRPIRSPRHWPSSSVLERSFNPSPMPTPRTPRPGSTWPPRFSTSVTHCAARPDRRGGNAESKPVRSWRR